MLELRQKGFKITLKRLTKVLVDFTETNARYSQNSRKNTKRRLIVNKTNGGGEEKKPNCQE